MSKSIRPDKSGPLFFFFFPLVPKRHHFSIYTHYKNKTLKTRIFHLFSRFPLSSFLSLNNSIPLHLLLSVVVVAVKHQLQSRHIRPLSPRGSVAETFELEKRESLLLKKTFFFKALQSVRMLDDPMMLTL